MMQQNPVPDALRKLLAYAQPQAEARDLPGLRTLVAAVGVEPERKAAGFVNYSYQLSLEGSYRAARVATLCALALQPRNVHTRVQLAARLRTFNEAGLLEELVAASGRLVDMPIPLLLSYAAQWSYFNRQELAIEFLDEAYRADPDYPPTLVSRGQVLTYLGRLDEARRCFERCIKRAPELPQAYWHLAHIRKASRNDNQIDALRRRLHQAQSGSDAKALLSFALHKELDDLGDFAGAWQALVEGCNAKRAMLGYDRAESRRLFDELHDWRPKTGHDTDSGGHGRTRPIFILGMHRSGTTLLEQMLDASEDVICTGELYDFTTAMRYATDHHCRGVIDREIVVRARDIDFREVGKRYLDGLQWRVGTARAFTDKLPSNFLNLGFICEALPDARILHMVRDPVEVCFSNLRELFSDANPYSYDQDELAEWYQLYARLMQDWESRYPGRILNVAYSELVADPRRTMKAVAEFCGIDYIERMSDPRASARPVATASAVQVRGGLDRRDVPKWKPYEKWLGPLLRGLAKIPG